MVLSIVRAGALFLLGIYAGGLAFFVLAPGVAALPGAAYTPYWQACNRDYGSRAPIVVLSCTALLIATCLLSLRAGWTEWVPAVFALLLVVLSIIVTVTQMEPLNRIADGWDCQALPSDWAKTREQWLNWQLVRTTLTVTAFVALLLSQVFAGRSGEIITPTADNVTAGNPLTP